MPRGVVNFHSEPAYSSVVPLATAAGALKSVSLPETAQIWRSCSDTMMRKPVLRAANLRADSNERRSECEPNLYAACESSPSDPSRETESSCETWAREITGTAHKAAAAASVPIVLLR